MERESALLKYLSTLPDYESYIVKYYGSYTIKSGVSNVLIVETEYAEKGSLLNYAKNFKKTDGYINQEIAIKIGKQLFRAAAFLKQAKILHGNLYSRNIFVKDSGDIVLGDFGKSEKLTEKMLKKEGYMADHEYKKLIEVLWVVFFY